MGKYKQIGLCTSFCIHICIPEIAKKASSQTRTDNVGHREIFAPKKSNGLDISKFVFSFALPTILISIRDEFGVISFNALGSDYLSNS